MSHVHCTCACARATGAGRATCRSLGENGAGPSGVGDLEMTEYSIHRGPLEREDGASVHLSMTEARFMPD